MKKLYWCVKSKEHGLHPESLHVNKEEARKKFFSTAHYEIGGDWQGFSAEGLKMVQVELKEKRKC